jgi:HpiC1 cyclase/PEP-CTERM motif
MRSAAKFLYSHRSSVSAAAVTAALAATASPAWAVPVTIVNSSFESPALSGPGTSNGPTGGVDGWTTSSTGTDASVGVWYLPQAPYFTIGAPDGNQVAFMYSGTGATGSGTLAQTTGALFQTGTTYTLSFEVGELVPANGFTFPATVNAILYEGSTTNVLATFAVAAPLSGPGTFQLDSDIFSAATNPFASGDVGIEFSIAGGPNSMATFDDVTLDAAPAATGVSEPTSLSLLGAGLIGFALLRRRRGTLPGAMLGAPATSAA